MHDPAIRTKGRQEWRRYVAFSFAMSDLLIELDSDLKIQFISGAVEELMGMSSEALQGRAFLAIVDPADRDLLGAGIELLTPGQRLSQRAIAFDQVAGQVSIAGFRLPDDEGRIYLAASRVLIPPVAQRDMERDAETGLLCHDDFTRLVEDQIQLLHAAGQDAALSLLQLSDLEGLRQRIGPEATERLFHELGSVMRAYSVGGDSAGRIADDKYGIVHSPGSVAEVLAGKVAALVRDCDPNGDSVVERRSLTLTEHLLNSREAAQAVRYVVNRFVETDIDALDVHSVEDGFEREMAETVERIGTLKRTVAEDSIRLVFQPVVTLGDRAVHHYEALSRFTNGESPFETITFAEQVGIVQDFDLAVAVKTRDFLKENLGEHPNLRVAVNLSPRSLESDGFVEALFDLMAEQPQLRPHILFELTETYKVRDLARADAITQRLRKDGHAVCLDDFGAGGASFDYIQAITVDFVKLDGTYIRRMVETERDCCILTAMANLCAMLNIKTIAEFVEAEEQADRLRQLGVDLGQGWLFGKPEPLPLPLTAPSALRVDAPGAAAPYTSRAKRRHGEETVWA